MQKKKGKTGNHVSIYCTIYEMPKHSSFRLLYMNINPSEWNLMKKVSHLFEKLDECWSISFCKQKENTNQF